MALGGPCGDILHPKVPDLPSIIHRLPEGLYERICELIVQIEINQLWVMLLLSVG